jgi:hypothetical protein
MKTRKHEANLISFKLLLNSKNQIISELKHVPEKDIERMFGKEEAIILGTLIERARVKLEPLHTYLQKEVNAL